MFGPSILARSLSAKTITRKGTATVWQYHPRSDRHSKVACWGIVFDLLAQCTLLKSHVKAGKICFGINHEMRDFKQNRKKNLDLVLGTPDGDTTHENESLASYADRHGILLDRSERQILTGLPTMKQASVGSVVLALEAKACMTEHGKARPRLYDELNSSQLTIHGDSIDAIAAGFVMINASTSFLSPTRSGETTVHRQPQATEQVVAKVRELPRRNGPADTGFDALAIVIVDCGNDGSPVEIVTEAPALPVNDIFSYQSMIHRLSAVYASRFPSL
ncbi:MAG: hypothetical protein KDF64_19775 [Geminicoccaceae bacterium]|nr:hypothetical protein [Geminicoccaceae bacterium]